MVVSEMKREFIAIPGIAQPWCISYLAFDFDLVGRRDEQKAERRHGTTGCQYDGRRVSGERDQCCTTEVCEDERRRLTDSFDCRGCDGRKQCQRMATSSACWRCGARP